MKKTIFPFTTSSLRGCFNLFGASRTVSEDIMLRTEKDEDENQYQKYIGNDENESNV